MGNYGPQLPGVRRSRCNLEWEENCPIRSENDVGNYGPRLPGVGGDMPKQVNSGVGGELPHQKRKSGVGSNILQQNGSVSKSASRPDRNSEVGRSKNG